MSTEAIDLDLREVPPYTAVLWNQFEQNPRIMYNLFERTIRPGGQTYQSDKVFDMSTIKLNIALSELEVKNVEELHRLTTDLLRMPIFFRVRVEHRKTEHYVVMKVRKKWTDEFAILVNTQHPTIREMLSRRLSEAMQYMIEGKKFCIKLRFGPSVRQWYSGIVDGEDSGCDSNSNSDDGHMNIYIHNYSTPNKCCMHPGCILCCFPFWLLCGGPCYFIHRKVKCIDVEESVVDLPVMMVTGQQTVVIEQHVHPQYQQNPQAGAQYNSPYGGPPMPSLAPHQGQYGSQQQMPEPPPYSP